MLLTSHSQHVHLIGLPNILGLPHTQGQATGCPHHQLFGVIPLLPRDLAGLPQPCTPPLGDPNSEDVVTLPEVLQSTVAVLGPHQRLGQELLRYPISLLLLATLV